MIPAEQKIPWREIPLLRLLLPFGLGVFLGYHFLPTIDAALFSGALILATFVLLFLGRRALSLPWNRFWSLLTIFWSLAFGIFLVQQQAELSQDTHFSQQAIFEEESSLLWSGAVEELRVGEDRMRLGLRINALSNATGVKSIPCTGQLLLYLPTDSLSVNLLPGQQIQFKANPERIAAPLNPDAFDFAEWQARKSVYHQARIEAQDWLLVDSQLSIKGLAYRYREDLLKILRKHLPTGSNELAVGAALILGKRDELSTDLRNAYAETGAVHVLAVSGLHLGFVAWGLGLLFGWGPFKKPGWRWLRLLLVLTGIWCFAMVTGLSPSVQRAAVMFSFLWLGQTLGRRASVYNSLGASALLLLLIDPYLLFDIGFQLSYLALLGIVFFQPRLYRLWYSPFKIVDYAWSLTTVAIAAQLTTFPLSLYYFHQFPLYFLLTGLVVVLAASFILGLGIALFLLHWITPLATLLGWLLFGVIWLNNAFIFTIQKLPGHLLSGIWINEWLLFFLFTALFFFGWYSAHRRTAYLFVGLSALVLALAINVFTRVELAQQRSWIVYHLYKTSVIDAFDGYHRYSISGLEDDDPALNWAVNPHRQKKGVAPWPITTTALHWYEQFPVYAFYDQRLAIINREWEAGLAPENPLPVDLLLIQDAPRMTLADLSAYFKADTWIFDGSNYPGQVTKWLQEAQDLGLSVHWTARDGAFQQKF
jgi:competence protein ComEC